MKKIIVFSLLAMSFLLFVGCEVTTESDDSATLIVDSAPMGAAIFLDGSSTGVVTPATLEIDSGTHQLRLELAGYEDYNETFTVEDDGVYTVLALMDLAINSTLNVTTSPAGASIYIDGAYTGYTSPAVIQGITLGYHYIRIYYPGYNEVTYYVLIQENVPFNIIEVLNYPVPPYPVFDITYP
ncbi:MAG: PEGA domain-containing protein, partial [Candidatus Cloacimonetes bacterium]|nr:PEGA domain-containing protein [Candidatus Cloacimonadota bacterium]